MTNNKFTRLNENGNSVFVTAPRKFLPEKEISRYSMKSLEWAYDNAYHGHFKGATNKWDTFLNAFIGKLGEYSVYNFFKTKGYELEEPETILRQKGEWDDGDLFVEGKKLQIKTTVGNSNFLLMRKKDWDKEGNYLWGKEGVDKDYGAFFLVRIDPDPRKLFTEGASLDEIKSLCENVRWEYEITGFVSKKDLIYAIEHNYVIPQGKMLNGKIKIREDLIYFQAGDLKDPELIPDKKF